MIYTGVVFCAAEITLALIVVFHGARSIDAFHITAAYQVVHEDEGLRTHVVVATIHTTVKAVFIGSGSVAILNARVTIAASFRAKTTRSAVTTPAGAATTTTKAGVVIAGTHILQAATILLGVGDITVAIHLAALNQSGPLLLGQIRTIVVTELAAAGITATGVFAFVQFTTGELVRT